MVRDLGISLDSVTELGHLCNEQNLRLYMTKLNRNDRLIN